MPISVDAVASWGLADGEEWADLLAVADFGFLGGEVILGGESPVRTGSGYFTDGESIADAEARLGRTVGPVQLKLILTAQYLGTTKTVAVTATRADNGLSQVLTASIPSGSPVGKIILLNAAPHSDYPSGYYTDVTNAVEVSGDGYLACQIVNDGPAWHSSAGVQVTHQAYSPYACDVRLASRDPDLAVDHMGRLLVVYCRDGQVIHRIQNADGRWEATVNVTQSANATGSFTDPSVVPEGTGRFVVGADDGTGMAFFDSEDDGQSWNRFG